jgi:iron(III) transport system substrate-binding protein
MSGIRQNRREILKIGGAVAAGSAIAPRVALGQATPASPAPTTGGTLTMYSGQHEDLVIALTDAFKAATGVTIEVRSGEDPELVNQILEEGEGTRADLFISEEPSPMASLDAEGVLTTVNADALAKTDARFNPENGNWLAYALRARVMFYNPEIIAEADLPASVLDLTDGAWKGTFAYAPSGAFVAVTNYLINTIGEDDTFGWLQGIAANGENLIKNGAIRDAVEAGQIGFGLSNHYYWYILAKEKGGEQNLTSRVHWVKGQDAGGLMLASGIGVLKASQKQDLAQQFIAWMADPEGGQKIVAEQSPQFPTAPGVASSYDLPSLDELDPPAFDQGSLKDSKKAQELIIEAGIV